VIAVVTPYGRNEVTAAAVRLADLASARGFDVRLVAWGVREQNIHPYWDTRVRSGRGEGVYRASAGVNLFVHFVAEKRLLEMTSLVSPRAKHVLVPGWHPVPHKKAAPTDGYNAVVYPCKAARQDRSVCRGVDPERLFWCRWDSGLPAVTRSGPLSQGSVSGLVLCDTASIDRCGTAVIGLIDGLLSRLDRLRLTVLSFKSWDRRTRVALRRAEDAWGGRLARRRVVGLDDPVKELHGHDWAVLPGVTSDFGLNCARALACGVPCVVHDVPPFNEHIGDYNGVVVPCGTAGGVVAVPDPAAWLSACVEALGSKSPLLRRQAKDWYVDAGARAFAEFWDRLFMGLGA
jgi:hypothetical protein